MKLKSSSTCTCYVFINVYINEHITCHQPPMSTDDEETKALRDLVELQKHRHRKKSCFRKHKRECRFGFPKPPMLQTKIMHPNEIHKLRFSESKEDRQKYKDVLNNWNAIYNVLENWDEKNDKVTFHDFLKDHLNLLGNSNFHDALKDYEEAISFSLKRSTIMLKRLPHESRINNYNKAILLAWRANMDLSLIHI